MEFLLQLKKSILEGAKNNAFFIDDEFYSYHQLAIKISEIRKKIVEITNDSEKLIGLVTNNDLETYASIFALWFEGKAYVPVNPDNPIERNIKVFKSTEIKTVIDSTETPLYFENYTVLNSKNEEDEASINLELKAFDENDLAYILFTSGSTGEPKGVPITFKNVNGLVNAVDKESTFELSSKDRCLQMFELTFDFSVVAYLFPILASACIYTIPKKAVKYLYIYKLMEEQKLTVLTMVPSIINYLRPYFSDISIPSVRYCSFGGGALYSQIASEWSDCLPNCKIFNYYGPTEFTVYSGFYPYHKKTDTKSYNGIISIGKPQYGVEYLIVDENNQELENNKKGELCLGGVQTTPGYWKDPVRNKKSFFYKENKAGEKIRFYKTGDICIKDEEDDFLYVERADFQVKVRGYRVELSEIEFQATQKLKIKTNLMILAIANSMNNLELCLAIEGKQFDVNEMLEHMKSVLPSYMIPGHVEFIENFPHNINGKVDRKELKKYFTLN